MLRIREAQGTDDDLARAPQNYTRLQGAHGGRVFAYGRDPYFAGCPDTLQLNYANPATQLWTSTAGDCRLVAVNYASNQSQCYVRLPPQDRGDRPAHFEDLMGPARFDRDRDDLAARGLYLDLPAWGYHVFDVTALDEAHADGGVPTELSSDRVPEVQHL